MQNVYSITKLLINYTVYNHIANIYKISNGTEQTEEKNYGQQRGG